MKKNCILCACAAAALMFASCQKEVPAVEQSTDQSIPDAPAVDMNVITATNTDTKTMTPDGSLVYWENNDEIALFVGGSDRTKSALYKAMLEEPMATATFVRTGDVEPGNNDGEYYALYPPKSLNKWASSMANAATRRVYVDLPKEQTAVVGGWDKNAGILASSSKTSTFQFQHIVSYVKFTVSALTTPFVKMTIGSKNNELLSGQNIAVIYKEDSIAYDASYTSGTYYSTVSISNIDNSVFTEGTYYVAILPGEFANGFSFTFENADGATAGIDVTGQYTLEGGTVADLGTIGILDFPVVEKPELPTELVLGKAYSNEGVVFWINPDNSKKGKIISGRFANITWGNASATKYDWAEDINTDDGVANQQYVLNLSGSNAETYPAVYFCKNLGEGWRLPTINEMLNVAMTYYGISGTYDTATKYYNEEPYKTNAGNFDQEMAKCLVNDPENAKLAITASSAWYWTGQSYYGETDDTNNGKCARVKIAEAIAVSGSNAKNKGFVRCVRDIEIQ